MSDDWELAGKKLFELTESGSLKWRRLNLGEFDGIHISGFVYLTETSGKKIVAFEEKTFGEDGWPDGTRPVVEFVAQDAEGRFVSEWRWPGVKYHYRLLESIRFHTAAGQDFLKSFLPAST